MSELILKNVYKRYENKKNKKKLSDFAVKDLNLRCKDGEFIALLGPSGCGKTTTLRMVAGLEEITNGEIFIEDKVINNVHPKDRGIGLAFEDYALYPPLNVYDNLAFSLRAKKVNEETIREEIMKIAPLLKVDELLESKVSGLSGGQKQRVNIARALVRKPRLLLLDEPLSHLDGKMRQVLRTEIKRLHKEIKCTTILVTHDQLEAMSLADRIAIMNEGVLQQYGTPNEIYNDPANEFVADFIGEPPMNLATVNINNEKGILYFAFNDSDVKMTVPLKYNKVLKEGMTVSLGIRPTNISIVDDKSEGSEVRISVFENLGEEKIISVKVGNDYLSIISNDEKRYKKGDLIKIKTETENINLFEIGTGRRIRA